MFSKLNCYKLETNSVADKETKLQKYLRERNEHILEKCFNIKRETKLANSNETFRIQEINNDELSGHLNGVESCQQEGANISLVANNSIIQDLKQTTLDALTESKIALKTEKTIKSESFGKNMKSPKSIRLVECSTKRLPNLASCKNSMESKFFNKMQSKPKNWKSPFTSFTTKGMRSNIKRGQQSAEFSYDLSRDELKLFGDFCHPMKRAPEAERQLLKNGQRKEYLMHRYEHSPVVKYNYPEATSWRIGWLLQDQ